MIDWFSIRQDQNHYFLKIKNSKTSYLKPLQAAHYTIDYICKNYPPPYTLMLSGGVDSQAMLYAWHTSGKQFNTFSGVYNDNFNDLDLSYIKKFSEIHNIPINFVNFNLLDFLQNYHISYVYKYRCGSPHMTTFMRLSEMITEGTVLMSGNFIAPFGTRVPIDRNNFGLYKYAKISNRSIVPYFFCETEELAYSFRFNKGNIERKGPRRIQQGYNAASYDQKVELYQMNGFPVIKQDYKMTGFEKVKEFYDENFKNQVTKRMVLAGVTPMQQSTRVFDVLLRNKYEREFQVDKYVFTVE